MSLNCIGKESVWTSDLMKGLLWDYFKSGGVFFLIELHHSVIPTVCLCFCQISAVFWNASWFFFLIFERVTSNRKCS